MRKTPNKRAQSVKAKQRANITFRMNILFFSIFILFTILILRLGYLQIVKGEDYTRDLERKEEVPVNTSVPRGRIFDSEGRILVDNKPQKAITYTKMQTTTAKDMYEIAEDLSLLIEKDTNAITKSDLQDFWLFKHSEEANDLVTTKERNEIESDEDLSKKDKNAAINRLIRSKITEEQLNSFTPEELEIIAIYREMASGYALSPQIIKGGDVANKALKPGQISEEVTVEEFARVSERLGDLKGVNTTTDWRRVKNSTLAILGTTTLPKEGIPKNRLDYFLSRDYSRNDRVGKSYIEQQYEEVLQGQKSVVKNITDGKGRVVDVQTVYEGEPGKDLVLTIDSELQTEMEAILEKKLVEMKNKNKGTKYLDRAFLVMLDPYTGEVLTMVGKQIVKDSETGKQTVRDYAFAAFTTAYEVGSTIKPGTVLTGYRENALSPGDVLIDQPIRIKGSNPKSSVFNRYGRIPMSDLEALERSSNSYMFQIAYRVAGRTYQPNQGINFGPEAFQKMRNGYAQMGLGVPTGIDLPGEVSGVVGGIEMGKLLDLSIGQYDTYTPLQLGQFAATLANGGNRIQPHVVKEIREPSPDGVQLGKIVKEITPNILNTVDNTRAEIERVRQGMQRVYFGNKGSARSAFSSAPYTAAGKTGTAQSFYTDPELKKRVATVNLTHIGFAPFDNPEIAYAIVVPQASIESSYKTNFVTPIARELVDKYFEIKQKNNALKDNDSSATPLIKAPYTNDSIDEKNAE
ncbi:peptidoglycan D,D-transpeptidase FtsI family protein [Psychrobacillus lasiicapitis]|uniref:serine-type D-Ala-D-Ala carboxypeptidase n=1 Tax=Psychrobacillus lasiicapitis TaxID=1636719 RepID=A0A544TA60_9BACI|nr:penicillin-binding protein 2 [Psychrobacillus lasiicapitis]TQR14343.1 penicillin-binding protein 2 [Psychrobacillus lasiicapitis]GGA32154.1 penicillin-binding protein [Psychrobacillus lasiicapitis]